MRTYARIDAGQPFTYKRWMQAVRRAETFVTYGPLLDIAVDGHPAVKMPRFYAGSNFLRSGCPSNRQADLVIQFFVGQCLPLQHFNSSIAPLCKPQGGLARGR